MAFNFWYEDGSYHLRVSGGPVVENCKTLGFTLSGVLDEEQALRKKVVIHKAVGQSRCHRIGACPKMQKGHGAYLVQRQELCPLYTTTMVVEDHKKPGLEYYAADAGKIVRIID